MYPKRTNFDSRPIRINIHTICMGQFKKKIQNGKLSGHLALYPDVHD